MGALVLDMRGMKLLAQYNSGRNPVSVFADYNVNGRQDAGEPSAAAPNDNPEGFSNFNGIYVLRPQAGRAFKVVERAAAGPASCSRSRRRRR